MTGIERLTAFTFLSFAAFLVARATATLLQPSMEKYSDQQLSIELAFILSIIASMTGFTREESIGRTTLELGLWCNATARARFLSELENKGFCENLAFEFGRRNGSRFDGAVSARLLLIHGIPHVVSLIRDMTENREAERQIHHLNHQLETERNAAQQNSLTDSLTGLSNRRYFDETLHTEFFRLKRTGLELSLIMMDVDLFKNYNDSYGHVAGDECLRRLAEVFLRMVMRAPDIVARYGGEEFVIILPSTNSQGATELAERIRKKVENLGIPHDTSSISDVVTISLGVITASPAMLTSPEQLVNLADDALYQAKNGGRNRVVTVNASRA